MLGICYSAKSLSELQNFKGGNSAGIRAQKFNENATQQDIVDFAKSNFFTNGSHEKYGRMSS